MNTKTKLNPNFNPRKRIDSFKKDFFDRSAFFFLTLPLSVNLFSILFFIIQVSILKFQTLVEHI